MEKINNKIALKLTSWVGSMWCAYAFAILSLVSLPAAIQTGNVVVIVGWIAQTFLQLVLLSVIIVGQNLGSEASEKRLDEILNLIETQQEEELQELRDDKKILKRELSILRKVTKK